MSTVTSFLLFPHREQSSSQEDVSHQLKMKHQSRHELGNNPWASRETKGQKSQLPSDSNISCPSPNRGKGKLLATTPQALLRWATSAPLQQPSPGRGSITSSIIFTSCYPLRHRRAGMRLQGHAPCLGIVGTLTEVLSPALPAGIV